MTSWMRRSGVVCMVFFSSRRRHTRFDCDWSSDVCSSDLALLSNDDALAADLLDAGQTEGEPGWRLPLWSDYRKNIDSTLADVKNTGGRYGGAINAGLFLREFVGDVPWAHLDVAGTAFVENANEYWPRGGTGSPARTL